MTSKVLVEEFFQFLYSGYSVPISFILLIMYFKFRNKINQLKFKFLVDICVIGIFIFSIDIMIFSHKYNDVEKSNIYSQDLAFMIDNYENNKLVQINIKDGILEEFRYRNDLK